MSDLVGKPRRPVFSRRGSHVHVTTMFLYFKGLEIVNPQAAEKRVAEANAKYFSSTASFVKVEKELWHK